MRKSYGITVILGFLLCSCTLHYYAKTGNVQGIKDAVADGAQINKLDDRGETPLMVAAFSGQAQVVDFLCRNGADINARSPYGATALIYAAYYGQFDATKTLLKYNPDKTIQDKFKNTALDYAEYYKFDGIVALLKTDDPQSIDSPTPTASKSRPLKEPLAIVNPSEPWTGKWRVDGSSTTGGLWVFKQTGQMVISTPESYFSATGSILGNELKGSYKSASFRRDFEFSFVLSQDKMSFEGYAADLNGMKPARGVRMY